LTHIEVSVYDILGRKIRLLVNEEKSAGYHRIEWNGLTDENRVASSGIYILRVMSEKFNAYRRIILLK
jgi:flagellar hook assembly protein FlgD